VSLTLRALQANTPQARVAWFEAVRACRRRERRDWRAAPVARIFFTADQSQLLQEEAVRHKIVSVLRRNRIHAGTFFAECDRDHDGLISERDLKNGLSSLEGCVRDIQHLHIFTYINIEREGERWVDLGEGP